MKKKLIITESQMNRLKVFIAESTNHSLTVMKMKEELDANYEPSQNVVREGGEYFDEAMIKVKVDEELITPKALCEYMLSKYKTGSKFTEQVIRDWFDGKISKEGHLSKNVAMNS